MLGEAAAARLFSAAIAPREPIVLQRDFESPIGFADLGVVEGEGKFKDATVERGVIMTLAAVQSMVQR